MAVVAVAGATISARADTADISGVITTVGSYQSAALVIGIGTLLYVLGRRVVKKLF